MYMCICVGVYVAECINISFMIIHLSKVKRRFSAENFLLLYISTEHLAIFREKVVQIDGKKLLPGNRKPLCKSQLRSH